MFASTALVVLTTGYLISNGDCLSGFHETLSPSCNYNDVKKEKEKKKKKRKKKSSAFAAVVCSLE